jgi:hypothetical protein
MRSAAAAEADPMEKATPRPAATKRAAKAATAKPASRKRAAPAPPAPPAEPAPAPRSRSSLRDAAAALLVLLAVTLAASAAVLLRDDEERTPSSSAAAVTAGELAARAGEVGVPIYWAGTLPGRSLELTTSATGAFVRYLPAGVTVGGEDRTLTIATYSMQDAYATAVRRAKGAGMTSRRPGNGGLAVWSTSQPTSVYVAWPGVPSLVEVYAPRAADARATALGGRVRPVG